MTEGSSAASTTNASDMSPLPPLSPGATLTSASTNGRFSPFERGAIKNRELFRDGEKDAASPIGLGLGVNGGGTLGSASVLTGTSLGVVSTLAGTETMASGTTLALSPTTPLGKEEALSPGGGNVTGRVRAGSSAGGQQQRAPVVVPVQQQQVRQGDGSAATTPSRG
jgi:hypothetical protein